MHLHAPPALNVIFERLHDTSTGSFNGHTDRFSVAPTVVKHNEGNDVAHLTGFFFVFFCFASKTYSEDSLYVGIITLIVL